MTLTVGAVGGFVEDVQSALNANGAQPQLSVDGDFGKRTVRAVAAFQHAVGAPAHGVVDEPTANALGLGGLVTAGIVTVLDFESILAAILGEVRLPFIAAETAGLGARRQRLRVLFASVPPDRSEHFKARLEDPNDPVGAEVRGELATATLAQLIGLLPAGGAASVTLELEIAGSTGATGHYFTWTPAPCRLHVIDAGGAAGPIAARVRNRSSLGGQLSFRLAPGVPPVAELDVDIDVGGGAAFEIVPVFGSPSREDGDAGIEVLVAGQPVLAVSGMVRVRKNAQTLSDAERDRFLAAFAQLNDRGSGEFQSFRRMHDDAADPEAHGNAGFLSWHRAYLLDLERELQRIDGSVTIPYWRFDEPAPNVFSPEFMGASTLLLQPDLAATNPMSTEWEADGVPGIRRRARPMWDEQVDAAPVLSQDDTLDLGPTLADFMILEGNPHGFAHTSFDGDLDNPATAPRDPLFFMLHCNVDRLWAAWQQGFDPADVTRYDQSDPAAYPPDGSPHTLRIGHARDNTMWPWNGVTGPPDRPPTAPRPPIQQTPPVTAPNSTPTVGDMIDFQGRVDPSNSCGFAYDQVEFE